MALNNSNKSPKRLDLTETDMLVQYFANKDKLVGSDDRVTYQHGAHNGNSDQPDDIIDMKMDDDLGQYKKPLSVFHEQKHDSDRKMHSEHQDAETRKDSNNEDNAQ